MEYRQLGASGLFVPVLSFGTATFGGGNSFFRKWGTTDVEEAKRFIQICFESGVNFFDTADMYSDGLSEEILGKALHGSRHKALISTKASFPFGEGYNNQGSSRFHLIKQVEGSLKRLNTDYIDIYHMHGFDGNTPVEETLSTLDTLIKSGKIRYIACSNFSGWHLMKSIAVSDKYGWNRYIAHQVYYSLINREFEWELMPLAMDQKVGSMVWSPLSAGRLGGRYSGSQPAPPQSRLGQGGSPVPDSVVSQQVLNAVLAAMEEIKNETGKTIAQIAINWLLQRPSVSNVVIGARTEDQLRENLGATGWNLTSEQIEKLSEASQQPPVYPYWHQRQNLRLNPLPVQ